MQLLINDIIEVEKETKACKRSSIIFNPHMTTFMLYLTEVKRKERKRKE